jgi:hypothetical protein
MTDGTAGSRQATVRARVLFLSLCWTIVPTSRAHADWLITPFIGTTFGTSTAFPQPEVGAVEANHLMFGGAGTWLSDGILGVEGEYAHAPRFFQEGVEGLVQESQVTTFTGHVIVAAPLAVTGDSLRPYVLAGLGLVHLNIEDPFLGVTDNSLGLQLGGGAIGFVSDRAALRFDLRHVRTLSRAPTILGEREAKLSFWRASVGVAIRY